MKTVLVVDDDHALRELILWKLTKAGYATLSAPDGEAGLAAATAGDTARTRARPHPRRLDDARR